MKIDRRRPRPTQPQWRASPRSPASTRLAPSRPNCSARRARSPSSRPASAALATVDEKKAAGQASTRPPRPSPRPSQARLAELKPCRASGAARGRAHRPHRDAHPPGPRPRPPRHPGLAAARGRVRRPRLPGRRRARGRDRLVQLRGAQHAARPSGAQHARHVLRRPRRARAARCCAPTRRRCRSG